MAIDGEDEAAERQRGAMARQRPRKEVELAVNRDEVYRQATYSRKANYVYAQATYREDRVDTLPARREVRGSGQCSIQYHS